MNHARRNEVKNLTTAEFNFEDFSGRWWTLQIIWQTDLNTEKRPRTFWKHSKGAGIETPAAHYSLAVQPAKVLPSPCYFVKSPGPNAGP